MSIPPDATVQDTLDRFASRRLREALPDGWTYTIEDPDYEGAAFCVYAYEPGTAPGVPHRESGISRDRMILAEAADALREALLLNQR